MSVNGEKLFFFFFQTKKKLNKRKMNTQSFMPVFFYGLFVRASESWESHFLAGKKKVTQNEYFGFCVISWRRLSSIQLFFLHIAGEIYLYQMWKLRITASRFYVFNLISKIVVLHAMRTVIFFIKWEQSNETGNGRKLRWHITRWSNIVSEFWKA